MRLKEMAEQIWKSHRALLLSLGVLLILNLSLFTALEKLVVPKVVEQERLFLKQQAEIRKLLHNKGGGARTPEQLYVLASQDLSKFRQAVPEYQEFTGLIEELLVLSNRAGLDITQISYSSEQLKVSPLLKFSLNFNVAGDYAQIKRFVHYLEQSVRLITIKQVSLQGTDGAGVDLRLSLETFFRPGSRES
jgi:Tfp pilus assembly protein PilO